MSKQDLKTLFDPEKIRQQMEQAAEDLKRDKNRIDYFRKQTVEGREMLERYYGSFKDNVLPPIFKD